MEDQIMFFDLADGRLGADVQAAFTKAQKVAFEQNAAAKVKLEITVYPHHPDYPEIGKVAYVADVVMPKKTPVVHNTLLSGGFIKKTGKTIADTLQYDMFKDQPNGNDRR